MDKAPLEVVCALKGLLGDGEVLLPDGRRLLSLARMRPLLAAQGLLDADPNLEGSESASDVSRSDLMARWIEEEGAREALCAEMQLLPIHPSFRLIALANRPGHPFLGNNFFQTCGDLFDTLVIENPDEESEVRLLQAFAPNRPTDELTRVARVFAGLRKQYESGVLDYPFSAREAVAVARHAESYPVEGVPGGAEDVLGFDGMSSKSRVLVAEEFRRQGFEVSTRAEPAAYARLGLGPDGRPLKVRSARQQLQQQRQQEQPMSDPRFAANMPKHGKVDEQGNPHVGGNTWAGGSGGSDTAGLGGRGGPYRLDGGHPVHQVSDADKAAVSAESRAAAAEMAKEALAARLEEIDMSARDY